MVSWHPAPPMAQVRSVLRRRQLVEIPGRLSIHLLRYLHPVPGTHPQQQAAAGGIGFTKSVLPPEALSLFGMLLGKGTESVLVFGAQDEFDFNRTCVHGDLSKSQWWGGLEWFNLVIWRNCCQLKGWGPRRAENCAGRSRVKSLKNSVLPLHPVRKFTFPDTEVISGIEQRINLVPLNIRFALSARNAHCHKCQPVTRANS